MVVLGVFTSSADEVKEEWRDDDDDDDEEEEELFEEEARDAEAVGDPLSVANRIRRVSNSGECLTVSLSSVFCCRDSWRILDFMGRLNVLCDSPGVECSLSCRFPLGSYGV